MDPFTAALDKAAKRESATGTPKNSRVRGLAFIQSFRKIVFQEVSITRMAPEMRAYLAEFTLTFHFPPPTSMFVPVDADELEFSARIGGATSIDAPQPGDDWAVGIALGCNMSSGGKFMKRLILLPLLIGPLFGPFLFSAPQDSRHTPSAESYAVYSVLIPQIASVPAQKFLIATDTVLYADTKSQFRVEPENLITREEFNSRIAKATGAEWDRIWKSQPCVLAPEAERQAYLSAMADYQRNSEFAMRLERRLDLSRPYELVDVSELVGKRKSERWAFAEKNGAYGVFEVSAVGFSSDMTLAIVYVGYDCPWCGRWALHILKKVDGNWKQGVTGCGSMS